MWRSAPGRCSINATTRTCTDKMFNASTEYTTRKATRNSSVGQSVVHAKSYRPGDG